MLVLCYWSASRKFVFCFLRHSPSPSDANVMVSAVSLMLTATQWRADLTGLPLSPPRSPAFLLQPANLRTQYSDHE